MKKLMSMVLVVMLVLCAVSAMADSSQHVDGTVEWHLDPSREYEPGTVVVKRNDGEIEETTIIKLMEDYNANPIRFKENYLGDMSINVMRPGPEYIVIANVGEIHGPVNYNGWMFDYGYIETATPEAPKSLDELAHFVIQPPTEKSIAKLNKGDLVVSTGRIWSVFSTNFELFAFNEFHTTLEPYDEYMEWAASQD